MTRKRFEKLMMAECIDRNYAAKLAALAMYHGIPYAKVYRGYLEIKKECDLLKSELRRMQDSDLPMQSDFS